MHLINYSQILRFYKQERFVQKRTLKEPGQGEQTLPGTGLAMLSFVPIKIIDLTISYDKRGF